LVSDSSRNSGGPLGEACPQRLTLKSLLFENLLSMKMQGKSEKSSIYVSRGGTTMGNWKMVRPLLIIALMGSLGVAYVVFGGWAAASPAPAQTAIAGTASLTGTVDATAPVKAAQVFIRNVDKHILYMVYTNGGQFRAVTMFPGNLRVWTARLDRMMGKANWDRAAASYAEGLLNYRASALRFSRQDREDLLAYMVKNFGPDAKPRAVRIDQEMPFDEAKLGKAMYI